MDATGYHLPLWRVHTRRMIQDESKVGRGCKTMGSVQRRGFDATKRKTYKRLNGICGVEIPNPKKPIHDLKTLLTLDLLIRQIHIFMAKQ